MCGIIQNNAPCIFESSPDNLTCICDSFPSHTEKITSLKKRNDVPYDFYSDKMWVLDTWISDIHINMALHLSYKCQGKNLRSFYSIILHINFDCYFHIS